MKKNIVFKNFGEFWHYTKTLSEDQIAVLFHVLPEDEQKELKKSYSHNGWDDLFKRNEIDRALDEIKKQIDIDMLYIRCKIHLKKSHYMSRKNYNYVMNILDRFDKKYLEYVIGNIDVVDINSETVLLIKATA